MTLPGAPAGDAVAQRNVRLLVAAQALGGSAPPIIISLGGLIGNTLASNPALATLPVSLYNLGVALSTIPAALMMRRFGRRNTYTLGAAASVIGAMVATLGILRFDFVWFCVGVLCCGFYGANVQNYRFAASDSVPETRKAKAVSWIMVGGLMAAIIGPQMVVWTRDAWPAAPFAGSFVGMAGLALLAIPLLLRLRVAEPPAVAGAAAPAAAAAARPLREIALQAEFIVAATAGVVSFGLMSFVMTAAPMAMVACGFSVGDAALGIQWHVLAMFGPSFFTGRLIDRFGKITITAVGLLLIAVSGLLALSGLELLNFWGSLILLGLGWNFGFIGATTLVTKVYRPAERAKVQALNDFLVFGTVAAASFSAGHLLNAGGWDVINQTILPLVALVLVMLGWLGWRNRKAAGPAAMV